MYYPINIPKSLGGGAYQATSPIHKKYLSKYIRVEVEIGKDALWYGHEGHVTSVNEADETLKVINDGCFFETPLSAVIIKTQSPCFHRPFFNFNGCSYITKTCLVQAVVGHKHDAAPPMVPVTTRLSTNLEDQHLRLWWVILRKTFPTASVQLIEPSFFDNDQVCDVDGLPVGLTVDGVFKPDRNEKALSWQIKMGFEKVNLMLFPIHCLESPEHQMGHWTLLALEKSTDNHEKLNIRYYDGMDALNDICLKRAQFIVKLAGVNDWNSERHNTFRQTASECTEIVMHYQELEMRHAAGEGWGSVLQMHPKHRQHCRLLQKLIIEYLLEL